MENEDIVKSRRYVEHANQDIESLRLVQAKTNNAYHEQERCEGWQFTGDPTILGDYLNRSLQFE